jgi:hypothetical protein
MTGFVKESVAKRLEGDRPSLIRALLVSILIGVGAAVVAYKLMRLRG